METVDIDNDHGNTDVPCIRPNGATASPKEVLWTENHDAEDSETPGAGRLTTGDDILRSMSMEKIRNRIQEMEKDVMDQVNSQIKHMVSEVLQQLEQVHPEKQMSDLFHDPLKYTNRKKSSKEGSLPEKQFLMRNSLLTDLFRIKHIRTIYHIFVIILITLSITTVIYDIVDTGSTNFGFSTIITAFGKFDKVLFIWVSMKAATFGVFAAFSLWSRQRIHISPKSIQLKIWDYCWLISFVVYQILFIVFPVTWLLFEDLPPASSMTVLMEQVRLLMKTHAFVRSNAPRALSYKPQMENSIDSVCPRFAKFLYFLFCPTLVYRNNYPRTKVIRWRIVAWNFTEVMLVIFYTSFISERLLIPVLRQFGASPLEPRALVRSIFGTVLPSSLIFLTSFYGLLHSWLNAFAELLRFADRMFYQDWWNSTSYGAYYRKWNVVVHDWLYMYIYKDMYEIVTPRWGALSTVIVFWLSAIFHEYILAFTFKFFYPVMLIDFGVFSLSFVFLSGRNKRAIGNIIIWFTLCVGMGKVTSLYSMEYYARINCPPHNDQFLDFFIPRSWTCHGLSNTANFSNFNSTQKITDG